MIRNLLGMLVWVLLSTATILAATDLSYVEFNTRDMDQLDSAIRSVEEQGVSVVHIFPPNAALVRVPSGQATSLQRCPGVSTIISPSAPLGGSFRAANDQAYHAWCYLIDEKKERSNLLPTKGRPLINDAEQFLDTMSGTNGSVSPKTELSETFTSNYLVGRVAVKIILMESNGRFENWTQGQINTAVAEMVQGLNFLAQQANSRNVNLSWVYEINTGVPTDHEPIREPSVPYYDYVPDPHWEFTWINDALSHFGFPRDKWDGVFDMANDMRKRYYANWGFSVFVVMDEYDDDHMFTDHKFAYVPLYAQYPGDPWDACFMVMTYHNDNWGTNYMHEVLCHETSHIFRAPDEYLDGCEDDDCSTQYGYLRIDNGNCARCNSLSVPCIMRSIPDVDSFCVYSRGHLGWRDANADGVSDAIKPDCGGWQAIPNVNPGDLVRIYTLDGDFVNLISVTANNMATQPANYVIWDGHNYDNQVCVIHQTYLVTINDGSPFSITLNSPNPSVKPAFSNIGYAGAKLSWKLTTSWAYVRCFIYDQNQNPRPIWDKLYSANYLQTLDLVGWPPNTYTAKFYAWRPDGGASQEVSYTFVQPCTHCGDADDNGVVNISDAVKLINYIFVLPTPFLGDCGTPSYAHGLGDADGNAVINISDAVMLINYIFAGGKCPHCSGLPVWGPNCP